ncbi:MAG: N-acetyltransferase [Anaerocolumna sp.]|nr:N-acetyltransferase [Anaerocolumna sp.]
MNIKLENRTVYHVAVFWNKTQDEEIRRLFPVSNQSLEEALRLFEESLAREARSYGKIILFEGKYIGDIWCYCIDEKVEKMAMFSILIFEKEFWGRGIASEATKAFIEEVFNKFDINKIGAFTYCTNYSSMALLKKNGFKEIEKFIEDGIESTYFEVEKYNSPMLNQIL